MSCSSLEVTDTSLRGIPASAISTLQAEPLDERLARDPLALVDRRSVADVGQHLAVEPLAGVEPVGGEVGQPVVVARDAGVGREHRVERSGLLDVAVGDGVDGAVGLVAGGWELMRSP